MTALLVGMRGPRVAELQAALERLGFSPGPIDGVYGSRTDAASQAAATHYGWSVADGMVPPSWERWLLAARPNALPAGPELHAWIDRAGVRDPQTWSAQAAEIGFAGVGLFVAPHGKKFEPFVDARHLRAAIDAYRVRNLDVALLTWVRASWGYLSALTAYLAPVVAADPTLRVHWDTEDSWNAGMFHRTHARRLWRAWHDAGVTTDRIGVTDYALIQDKTRVLIDEGVALTHERGDRYAPFGLPQAYSVGYIVRKGQRIDTTRSSIYWPGTTQATALSGDHWGSLKGLGGRLEPGIAAYKPVAGLTVAEQVQRQYDACRAPTISRVWVWQLQMGAEYQRAFAELAAGQR